MMLRAWILLLLTAPAFAAPTTQPTKAKPVAEQIADLRRENAILRQENAELKAKVEKLVSRLDSIPDPQELVDARKGRGPHKFADDLKIGMTVEEAEKLQHLRHAIKTGETGDITNYKLDFLGDARIHGFSRAYLTVRNGKIVAFTIDDHVTLE